MLPDDEVVKDLYTDLASRDFDSDEGLDTQDVIQYGGLNKTEVWGTVKKVMTGQSQWDSIEAIIHPTEETTGRYYQVMFQSVTWSDSVSDWVGSSTEEITQVLEESFGVDSYFQQYPEVENNNLNSYIQSTDGFPYQLTVTKLELTEIPELVQILMTKTNRHVCIRIRPDDTFDTYSLSWQYLEWDLQDEQFTPA